MGLIFAKDKCEICGDEGNDYDNPILTFSHCGKRNGTSICFDCLKAKMNYEKLKKNNKYIVYD
jgi:hypothetical protein